MHFIVFNDMKSKHFWFLKQKFIFDFLKRGILAFAQELDKIHTLYMRASFVDQLRESKQSLYAASIERVLVYIRSG